MATAQEFLAQLRYALNHLYDPHAQRASPLMATLGMAGRSDAVSALQQALVQAIEALKPRSDVPLRSPLRRTYEILLFRYVQQWSQQEVADQLGISIRHLRREQHNALEVLAQRLRERFHLEMGPQRDPDERLAPEDEELPAVGNELAWLQSAHPAESIRLGQVLPPVLDLARSMASAHEASLRVAPIPAACDLAVHPVAFRQIILSLLGVGVRQARGGSVAVSVQEVGPEVRIGLHVHQAPPSQLAAEDMARMEMVQRLLRACGGTLELSTGPGPFAVTVILPASEQVVVLVVDDNADTLRLLQRYLSGTRYRFVGCSTLEQALAVARENMPRIIVLDVMMPAMDGWELLGRFHQHPLTRGIPIIVCTILAEEELAHHLGAGGFVQKPVSRESFLGALDHQLAMQGPG